jgi:dCMP deaminase
VDNRFVEFYLDVADRVSELSRARRLKVGAVIVKDHRILSYGYNGTPSGFDNNCEIEIEDPMGSIGFGIHGLVTKPEVIHAEMNAILKVAQSNESTKDAVLFLTHSPCIECAKAILQSGIKTVHYKFDYRSLSGLELLQKGGVTVIRKDV